MQSIGVSILNIVKKQKIRKLEIEIGKEVSGRINGELFICPFCQYVGKNTKGTAKIFVDAAGKRSFKCFCCGKWRGL